MNEPCRQCSPNTSCRTRNDDNLSLDPHDMPRQLPLGMGIIYVTVRGRWTHQGAREKREAGESRQIWPGNVSDQAAPYTGFMPKIASPDYPIDNLISKRWSPYVFSKRLIPREDLLSMFEAARWAASSFNEQPWRYLVASRNQDQDQDFARILSCLLDGNQAWAREAPALAIGCTRTTFSRNNKPNRVALHDLGLASASLSLEATSRGVQVHQMAGILPDKAREVFAIPKEFEAVTALAMGYWAGPNSGTRELRSRDEGMRTRRPQREFVFAGEWGRPGLGSAT